MSDPNENDNKITVDKEVIEELAQSKEAIANLTEEIKDLRAKKNEEIELLKKQTVSNPEKNVETEVDKILQKKEIELLEKAKEEAIIEFRESLPEFSTDNDPGNLKFKAFERELRKFNLSDLKSKEEVKKRLKEAYEFANRGKSKDDNYHNPYATTKKNGGTAGEVTSLNLSDKEKKLIRMQNLNEEQYLKMREKRPHYINSLLRFVD